jgi:hypothetical protein
MLNPFKWKPGRRKRKAAKLAALRLVWIRFGLKIAFGDLLFDVDQNRAALRELLPGEHTTNSGALLLSQHSG